MVRDLKILLGSKIPTKLNRLSGSRGLLAPKEAEGRFYSKGKPNILPQLRPSRETSLPVVPVKGHGVKYLGQGKNRNLLASR
jgi:hypothetical protein